MHRVHFVTLHRSPFWNDLKVAPLASYISLSACILMVAGIVLPFSPYFSWPRCCCAHERSSGMRVAGARSGVRTFRSELAGLCLEKGVGLVCRCKCRRVPLCLTRKEEWNLRKGRYCPDLENYVGRKTCPKLGFRKFRVESNIPVFPCFYFFESISE